MHVWQQAGGRRHGRVAGGSATLPEDSVFHSLCGRTLTVEKRDDRTREGAVWLDPTCSGCDYLMRRAEHAPAHDPDYVAALEAAL